MFIVDNDNACHCLLLGGGAFHRSVCLVMKFSNRDGLKPCSWVGLWPFTILKGGVDFPAKTSMDVFFHLKSMPDGPEPVVP